MQRSISYKEREREEKKMDFCDVRSKKEKRQQLVVALDIRLSAISQSVL